MVDKGGQQIVGVPRAVLYGLMLVLTAVAGLSGWWAYNALEPLWGYQDNDTSVYLALGLPAVAAVIACAVGIICLLRLTQSPSTQPRRGRRDARSLLRISARTTLR